MWEPRVLAFERYNRVGWIDEFAEDIPKVSSTTRARGTGLRSKKMNIKIKMAFFRPIAFFDDVCFGIRTQRFDPQF